MFDYAYEFEFMNGKEIVLSVEGGSFKIFNMELRQVGECTLYDPRSSVQASGSTTIKSAKEIISYEKFWLFGSSGPKFFVWKHGSNMVDVFTKSNGDFVKSVMIESLSESDFLMDLSARIIVYSAKTNELRLYNDELCLLCECNVSEALEGSSLTIEHAELMVTSDNQIAIVDNKKHIFYLI